MRYGFAILMLLAVLPVMNLLAAPAPDPYAILDIGPPPKGETAEQYRKRLIDGQTFHGTLCIVWSDTTVKKLPSVVRFKDARPWLAKNIRVTPEEGERRLRFTFRDGTRVEQVAILNAFLRENLSVQEHGLKHQEWCLSVYEKCIIDLESRIRTGQKPPDGASYQNGIDGLRSIEIPKIRAEIARLKQFAVIRWAR